MRTPVCGRGRGRWSIRSWRCGGHAAEPHCRVDDAALPAFGIGIADGTGAGTGECRPAGRDTAPSAVADYKARAATRWGCTHFIESEAEQAVRIAAAAPHLVVTWWSAAERRGMVVGAAAGQPAAH